jgi:hypothetical protein
LVLLGLGWTAVGCVQSYQLGPAFQAHAGPPVAFAFTLQSVSFKDQRTATRPADFDTPHVTTAGDGETRTLRDEMERRLTQAFRGGSKSVNAEIVVKSGSGGWDATWGGESSFAEMRLKIVFTNPSTGEELLSSWGEAWGRQTSTDVTDEEPKAVFRATTLAAFDRALGNEELGTELERALHRKCVVEAE